MDSTESVLKSCKQFAVQRFGFVLEARNVRYDHEYKVRRDVKLPAGKILIVSLANHASDVVEHFGLIADRIIVVAELVGRETHRVHPQIA